MTNHDSLDFLALLSDERADESEVQLAQASDVVAVRASPAGADESAGEVHDLRLPTQVGRVGKGRFGGLFEKRLLGAHMRACKLARRAHSFSSEVRLLLEDSRFVNNAGDIVGVRTRAAPAVGGLVLELSKQSRSGNRYKRSISWAEFLEAAFGKFKRNAAVAIFLDKGPSTIKNMQVFVSGAWMNQQALTLAKLAYFASTKPPLLVIKHMKFDETALLCSLNPDKGRHRSRSTWQTMVYRLRIILVWENGDNLVVPLVLPPVVLLSTGAAHQFYALNFHPSFRCVNRLIKVLQDRAEESFDLLEADGASSNEKLLAHMYQLARQDGKLMSHARCMSHATQLVNVALLASVDAEAMNRLYGLTVFLRNLGYWGRLQQALRQWVSQTLVFKQEAISKSAMPEASPHVREFMNYLQFWKDLESESQDSAAKAFKSKASRLLDLINGSSVGGMCHICTSTSVPVESRHCADRADCVRKIVEVMTDLFLSCMPTVPVPSKWTTMFASLDFCMGGFLFANWLPEVFQMAFGTLRFAEFEEGSELMDPRLIESLSFSAVNGRRFQNSLRFLQDRSSMWTISLLTLVLEASRCLTYFWLGSLKKSLHPQRRCVLYEVLDPAVSVVEAVLQHLSELVMSIGGRGRLRLLYRDSYASYQQFCSAEPGRVRQLRRVLLLMSGWVYRRQHVYMHDLRYSIAVVGDLHASPDVLAHILQKWDTQSICCVPHGVARMLKQRGLSSADLCTPRWRLLLSFYARSLTWSIADVEQSHAANRQNAGAAFSTICAKYINSEALRQRDLHRRIELGHQSHEESNQTQLPSLRSGSDLRKAKPKSNTILLKEKVLQKKPGAKAESALLLFRKDYLQRQSLSGRVRFNPCSHEAWQEVKEHFAQLPEPQRLLYESLASDSVADAATARARWSQRRPPAQVPAMPAESMSAAPAHVPCSSSSNHELALPTSRAPCHVSQLCFEEFAQAKTLQDVMRKFEGRQEQFGGSSRLAKTSYPVTEKALQNIWKSQRQNGITWRSATDRFRAETERIARPQSAFEAFPQSVTYESNCGAQCRTNACAQRVSLHVNLTSALASVVKQLGRIADAVKADVLLACEVFNDARQRVTTYAFMTAMSARSGVHPAEQVYAVALPVGGLVPGRRVAQERFNGLRLQLSTIAPTRPLARAWLPFQGDDPAQRVGRLSLFTTDEFCKELLDMTVDSERPACTVVLTRLSYQDLWPSTVQVTGVDCSLPPVIVKPGSVEIPEPINDVDQDGDVEREGDEEGDAADTAADGFDLLQLLVQDQVPQPRPRKARARAGSPAAKPSEDAEAEDLLADPEMQAILGHEEVVALREALRTCRQTASASSSAASAAGAGAEAAEEVIDTESDSQIEEEAEIPADSDAALPSCSVQPGQKRKRKPGSASAASAAATSGRDGGGYVNGGDLETASAAASSTTSERVLRINADGSQIKVVNSIRGLQLCHVERVPAAPRGPARILGSIKRMVAAKNGRESLQAVCKAHSQCQCWLSNTDNLDLLLDWVAHADQCSAAEHETLSNELKLSIGMRVRGLR